MKSALLLSSVATVLATLIGANGAPSRATLEIWGASPSDALEVDGAPIGVKMGVARAFTGQPLPEDAPARIEVAAGQHVVTLRRGTCTARTFLVETQGSYKRSVVLAPVSTARCAIPTLPPRAR